MSTLNTAELAANKAAMKLKLTRSMWGIIDPSIEEHRLPAHWEANFKKLQAEGYEAIEAWVGSQFNVFKGKEQVAKELLVKYGMDFVAQGHTIGYPVTSRNVDAHVAHFRELVQEAKDMGAVMINVHSGCDSWSYEQSLGFFKECLQIEQEIGIKVVHETHRQRVLYNPWITRDLLTALPNLKINADFSHFCVVAERVFDNGCNDPEWPPILELMASRCHLIHARVGYAEGPQVCDPAAPEYKHELMTHEQWWSTIWNANAVRGEPVMYVEPEHGPPPYLHTVPFTNVPVTDLWRVNSFIGERVQKNFAAWQTGFGEPKSL